MKSRMLMVVIMVSVVAAAFALATLSPSLNHLLARNGAALAATETVATFAAGCTTPDASFTLGQTACAIASGAPANQRRFVWVAPDGSVTQVSPITTDPASDSYAIPTTGAFAQTGRWVVKTVDRRGVGRVSATFVVLSATAANADLMVTTSGPAQITAGSNVTYTVTVTNQGPDAALAVELKDVVPTGTTFVSETQVSGPTFSCANSTVDDITMTTCTISSLAANASAAFSFVYHVDAGAEGGTLITDEARVSSATNEVNQLNNTSSATTVVGSTTPCTLSCPSNITRNNDAGECGAIVSYATPGGANCAGVTCSPPSGAFFPLGSSAVTCTGDTGSPCSFTVTINDTQSHNLSCPANITVNESTAGSGIAEVNYTAPTTSACSGEIITCDPPSGSLFQAGTTAVTCTSSAGPTCSFTVTVNSTAGCTLSCPANISTAVTPGQCSATVTYTAPTGSGSCGTVTCAPASGSTFPAGVTTVTCTSSQGASCDFTVTVVDANPPTITTCPASRTISADENCQATIPDLSSEVVAAGCGVTISQFPAAGGSVAPGTSTITITAANAAGQATCAVTLTVLNTVASTITCPADVTQNNDAGQCGAVVNYPDPPDAGNACSSITVSCLPPSGSFFPTGVTNVSCTATDVSGNTATCTFKVTVIDTQAPAIICPANITRSNDANQCGAVVNYASPTVTDNCPGVTSTCTPASGTQFSKGTMTVNCTATDTAGNAASCSFTITITDTQAPTITCPANIEVGAEANTAVATVSYQTTVSDNCTGATSTCLPASGTQFPVGTTTVNCTATDAAGNTAACSFTVTVTDNQPPTITCPASITKANDANQCGAVTTYANPVVTDNSPGATASCSPASGSVFAVGTTAVTCTATDVGGNHATCSFTVTVNDIQAPVISCPANITVGNTTGQCSATVNPGTATATDNCPGVTVVGARSDGLALGAAYPVGTTVITWTARDGAVPANQTTCTQTITVNDTQAPTITLNPTLIELWPPNHQYTTINISNLVSSATDNCSGNLASSVVITRVTSDEGVIGDADIVIAANCKSVQLRRERLGTGDGRVYRVYLKVTDAAGNVTTTSTKVTVPHSQNGNPAVEGAAAYTVVSSCP